MKCIHCGKDIPQRLILADAARILAKKNTDADDILLWIVQWADNHAMPSDPTFAVKIEEARMWLRSKNIKGV